MAAGSDYRLIRYAVERGVARLTLDRPDKLNAINAPMVAELNHALDRAEADEGVRAIVLDGAGRAFSAGFDLQTEADAGDAAALRRELEADLAIIMRFWNCPKPTVAAVHQWCLGSAMEMALACDVTVAAADCRFGAPEVRFGSGIVCMILPWLCGPKRAKELLLTGNDRVSAEQAEAWGLVNRVVPTDRLQQEALALAREIAANDALAVRLTKRAVNRAAELAGMPAALAEALALDVEIESTETEESRAFNEVLEREGTRAAIAWRNARLGNE
ncbi:MAG: enoyl-CoA hydratase/isomerase family protein [Xanthomonadales bacterium]|nr:enoyl-CoA hydratase/isomerase family protein [Xanthomonadales bacterium]NIN58580.1 enoyl-CoA hydratase/isomerase family protein [Xanthomonadales bacterium]NIN73869.1 enoyl-CoA hydratase/isomerase family protein [Xanthomonadales bacterium]NIO12338.1 enoyl-CoA hydratase/isomerase family protein [Xanthomonadales bacterium]NIP10973.1 enoyl-CoA hydratase/isomerase family protein [Xanthomonadales bacterium]